MQMLQRAAEAHLSAMVKAPSEYLPQNFTTMPPCCPRGALYSPDKTFVTTTGTTRTGGDGAIVQLEQLHRQWRTLVDLSAGQHRQHELQQTQEQHEEELHRQQQAYWQARHDLKIEGPWRDCFCHRIQVGLE